MAKLTRCFTKRISKEDEKVQVLGIDSLLDNGTHGTGITVLAAYAPLTIPK